MTNFTHNSFLSIYFNSLRVSSNLVLIIRRINCINKTSGICHSVSVIVSCAYRQVPFRSAQEMVTDTEWHLPEVVLIQLILLMMSTRFRVQIGNFLSDLHTKPSPTQSDIYQRLYWYNWFSWWWVRGCSKHVENLNKYIDKKCASSWSFTTNHNKMHGQQNIK